MTIEERLREALDGYCPSPNYPENFLLELAARGLAVCELPANSQGPKMTEDEEDRQAFLQGSKENGGTPWSDVKSNMDNGEPSGAAASPGNQSSGDVLTREGGTTDGSPLLNRRVNMAETEKMLSEPAGSHSAEQHKENAVPLSCDEAKERMESDMGIAISDREQAIARYLVGQGMESWRAETEARAIIAADPWTKDREIIYKVHAMVVSDVDNLRAEVERLNADFVKFVRDAGDLLASKEVEVERLRSSLRDCLHLLDTAENLTVTDRPAWNMDRLVVSKERTWVQTFRDTEAVKRARGLLGMSISADRAAATLG